MEMFKNFYCLKFPDNEKILFIKNPQINIIVGAYLTEVNTLKLSTII